MTITLKQIWDSSTGLLKRFDLKPSLWVAWQKVIEEHVEFIEAIQDLDKHSHLIHLKQNAAKELAFLPVVSCNRPSVSDVCLSCS